MKTNGRMGYDDRKSKAWYNGRLAAEPTGDRTPPLGRFIDYPAREYPSKLLARGSTLTPEGVNEIVSALWKHEEWSGLTSWKPAGGVAPTGEQTHGLQGRSVP